MRQLITKLLGDPNVKVLKKLQPQVEAINALEGEFKKLSKAKLAAKTAGFRARLEAGESLDALLPEAFATVREASRRQLGLRHFDVQLLGGIVLHGGSIAEMRTGEGKTLAATLPVYLNALANHGVHVVTVNDYLARRDAGWMGAIYHFLGLSTAVITNGNNAFIYDPDYTDEEHEDERLRHLRPVEKREAYAADITYGTNNEFGFDYLRDNMVQSLDQMSQRKLSYAIIDEVDSILIDEARTPLIISAPATEGSSTYAEFARVARTLNQGKDYVVDEKAKAASLTDEGVSKVEKLLGLDNLYKPDQIQNIYHLEQALKAEALFKRDRNYVVREGEVIIVDEFTGRLMPGRRYSEGLHQAIEAKEGVEVMQESMTLATVSFQNYFRLYEKLAGMTGTAETEAEEFHSIYNLDVVVVPTNKPNQRVDLPDRIYKTEEAKLRAIAREIKARHEQGQPVLIGTVSIEKNELLGDYLREEGIPHETLNAKNNEREAGIVARAGEPGAVTLATNIAGRGTDIVLGKGVVEAGGLHVLGSERHESRRIDNQLRGRAGRQGDPGSTQFYVSLEDDIMRIFGGDRIGGLMNTLSIDEDTPIENNMVSKALESAQKRVESHHFDIRKQVLQYDDVMNRHRETIYARRRGILGGDVKDEILELVAAELEMLVAANTSEKLGDINREEVLKVAATIIPLTKRDRENLEQIDDSSLKDALVTIANAKYAEREAEFGEETMRNMERWLYLGILDRRWMEHLESMGHLREGIGLRGVGQRDPLSEYKKEGYHMFQQLLSDIEHEVATTIFKIAPRRVAAEEVETDLTQAAANAVMAGGGEAGGGGEGTATATATRTVKRTGEKVGRNDPCPCGSGLKYKKCGLIDAPEHKG